MVESAKRVSGKTRPQWAARLKACGIEELRRRWMRYVCRKEVGRKDPIIANTHDNASAYPGFFEMQQEILAHLFPGEAAR